MEVCQSSNAARSETTGPIPCLISARRIAKRVRELAQEISADYAGEPVLMVGVLHGAFVFMADLVRHLTIPVRCGFVMVSSYGDNTVTSGRVELHLDLLQEAEGEHLLLVDDIVDTGYTIQYVRRLLLDRNPRSLRVCALLDKVDRHEVEIPIDYVGFRIPDYFVVGYGLDIDEKGRNLPYVASVDLSKYTL